MLIHETAETNSGAVTKCQQMGPISALTSHIPQSRNATLRVKQKKYLTTKAATLWQTLALSSRQINGCKKFESMIKLKMVLSGHS